MANRILPGYLMQVGTKMEVVIDHDGPASYSNIGTNSGTGDVINAIDLGFGGLEYGEADGVSSDGLNYVYVTPASISTSGNIGSVGTSVALRWFVVSTGAEVANGVNLSTKAVRIRLRGV